MRASSNMAVANSPHYDYPSDHRFLAGRTLIASAHRACGPDRDDLAMQRRRSGVGQVLYNATPRQVALRFVVRRPSVFAIVKAGHPEHTAENAGAADLQLSAAEITRIEEVFPLYAMRCSSS